MTGRFDGKVALVTGAARGIGRGVALCLAEEGADIIVNDRPPDPDADIWDAQDTADEIMALGQRALVQYADVSDRDAVAGMYQAAVAHFGRVDVVVANAALTIREPFVEAAWANILRTVEVTQFGVYHTCQLGARAMLEQGNKSGKIVIISSILSEIPLKTSAPYNMAKAGVIQLARTMAAELADHNINVNVVNPGWIDTPGEYKLATEEELRAGAQRIPLRRLGVPRDIGKAVTYLASSDADYVTGAVLKVDGGYTLGLRDEED